jgi:Fur family ferric uptake transcriptional regulator
MSANASTEGWTERAEATLAAAGHRRGGARRALLELLDRQECALTAQEIEDALRVRDKSERVVSRASVYRILDELERCATSACASTTSITTISCATSAGW